MDVFGRCSLTCKAPDEELIPYYLNDLLTLSLSPTNPIPFDMAIAYVATAYVATAYVATAYVATAYIATAYVATAHVATAHVATTNSSSSSIGIQNGAAQSSVDDEIYVVESRDAARSHATLS